jgi:uncharacterized C2H2 Zn-finger protein
MTLRVLLHLMTGRVKQHVKINHDDGNIYFQCEVCARTRATNLTDEQHVRSSHIKQIPQYCNLCGDVFPTKFYLEVHNTNTCCIPTVFSPECAQYIHSLQPSTLHDVTPHSTHRIFNDHALQNVSDISIQSSCTPRVSRTQHSYPNSQDAGIACYYCDILFNTQDQLSSHVQDYHINGSGRIM